MISLDLQSLRKAYLDGNARPSDVIDAVFTRVELGSLRPVFISLVGRDAAMSRAVELEAQDIAKLPLYGVPFAVKDNIDVAGMETTAGCPAFAYVAERSATVVQRLIEAGAILVGKTNMDQFATGLVGTRTPYGECSSVFDERYISGGSSSGSAVAVARASVSFTLGTDTAGSGRVPAAFNNIVGLKPTRGRISMAGVVPACRTLDCVSVFALTCSDAHEVMKTASGFDPADPYSRAPSPGQGAAPWAGKSFRFGCPPDDQLEFFDDAEAAGLFVESVMAMQSIGGERVDIDFTPFRKAAELLYAGPWVAERFAAVGEFIAGHPQDCDPVVASIVSRANQPSAVEAFRGQYALQALRAAAEIEWSGMDVLLVPTAPATYTIEQIQQDPVRLNSNLGYYTNFVNLMDLAAVAVPAGFRSDGLPFGVSIIGHAFSDEALLQLSDALHRSLVDLLGGTEWALDETPPLVLEETPGCIPVAVVGAHLSGQPLNWQLTDRGARLQRATRTAPGYRLYALGGTKPAKPGLVRDQEFQGPGIEVEVWAVPEQHFGSFVSSVPAPLGIGNATLEDGSSVKCFICESYAITNATEITRLGGWRAFLSSQTSTASR